MTDEVAGSRDVSRLQDLFVMAVVALIGTAVALGVYLQGGFGIIPSLCVGSGLFIWLLSAHFLMTRMRLKRLIDGRIAQLSQDVSKLKKEVEVTDLLAEGHNELASGQDALEKALQVIVSRIDQYDSRLKAVYKIAKKKEPAEVGEALPAAERRKLLSLSRQFQDLDALQGDFEQLALQLKRHEHRADRSEMQHYTLMRAQLDVLELVVQQLADGSADEDRSQFAMQALEAIRGLRHVAPGSPAFGAGLMGGGSMAGAQIGEARPAAGLAALPPGLHGQLNGQLNGQMDGAAMKPLAMPQLGGLAEGLTAGMSSEGMARPVAEATGDLGGNYQPRAEGGQAGLAAGPDDARPKTTEKTAEAESGGFEEEMLLAAINEAIEADRIDLYLQPIVSLPERELTYYEAFSRLRNELGQVITPRDFLPVAEMAELVPIIDNQIILRVIQVVQRLAERGKGRLVFVNLSISSLRDAEFFAEFMDFMEANKWLSEHLVFEFTQEAVDSAGAYEHERMAAIAKLGFRFSMDQINRLDIDFKALSLMKFAFLKVDASLLLGSMDGSRTEIHSADLSAYLRRLNITMIVDMVEREAVVRQLRDYKVAYAQGLLFCEPKPVRPEVFGGSNIVAA